MATIRCPKCKEVFTVDESDYQNILSQIKNEEFEKELAKREKEIEEKFKLQNSAELTKANANNEKTIMELNNQIKALKLSLEAKDKEKELELQKGLEKSQNEIVNLNAKINSLLSEAKASMEIEKTKQANIQAELKSKYNEEILKLKNVIDSYETDKALALAKQKEEINKEITDKEKKINELISKANSLKEQYQAELKLKDEQIQQVKDFKAKLSTKGVGEDLEQYCLAEFNKVRSTGFQNAYFAKDNEAIKDEGEEKGTKADFIFKDYLDDGTEYISICFEMKNQNDTTATKHKNEDFFKKLDDDRRKKGCEYAVLVSVLDEENEFYNTGIVEAPDPQYKKMYVIRPQFFIPIISLLRNAALNSANSKRELAIIKNQNMDITNFEKQLEEFKSGFQKNVKNAATNFQDAIKGIDDAIKELEDTKESLRLVAKHLGTANNKLDDLTIKKLTKNNPTMQAKFKELEDKKED